MTIKFWSGINQDSVTNRAAVTQDTFRLNPDSAIFNVNSSVVKPVVRKPVAIHLKEKSESNDTTSVCSRNPVADITFYNPDYLINTIDPSGINLFPYLFTDKTRQMYSDRKASVEKHLKAGENMPRKLFHDDWNIGIILAALLLFSLVSATKKSFLPDTARFFLFRGTKEDSSRDVMGIFQWQTTILNLSSFFIIALYSYFAAKYFSLIPPQISEVVVWLIALAAIIIAVTVRHVICIVTGILSTQEEVFRDYLHTVYQSYRLNALFLFTLVIMMSYTSFLSDTIYFISGGILFSTLYLIRILRLFIIFINRNISIFYLILYLCALEILPVLISIKYFSGLT
ncbi:MAG: hypothetical protein A2X05_09055 [Bacteroidetes bacterium GWE2_41_25]|nr:MAG: hypothetical protein A2X03_04760 [Bacteroidetes bacterium GWA2_40_15]OFX87907.1 MAG: hypothetical protein A2X06_08370 [Bacteroidetes bacterium GWC2_40_22]OFY05427.1 MAG: hypothetical protein A2X05_09055 [Bacteroidetes bacterium GWE2_41_25]OFY59921.1 MAG: hypothetical protein A2X04_02180 [Bacteroidetes bacterium GWF2_41_9]HAM11264.1 hypothetical protein [Bacteroidales bacterium]